jgi:iron only hydrogenase large subunit-like protein
VAHGLSNAQQVIASIRSGEKQYHFIEVMTCPGGCIGGGGQPYDTDADAVKERLERLYEVDRRSAKRRAHENADVRTLYEDLLGTPLSEVAHRLLHRGYVDRSPAGDAAPV